MAKRHGTLGYKGQPRMNYDYWNTPDHLAALRRVGPCVAHRQSFAPVRERQLGLFADTAEALSVLD